MTEIMEILKAYFDHSEKKYVLTEELVEQAKSSRLTPFVYAMTDFDHSPETCVKLLKQDYFMSIQRDLRQEKEYNQILDELEKRGIDVLPLKGYWMKKEYPASNFRFMGDLDILVRIEDFQKADEVLKLFQYVPGKDSIDSHHLGYEKKPIFEVELHRTLVANYEKQYGKAYLDTIWERVVLKEGSKHIYRMTNEDFFLHAMFHALKHYINAGTGIRTFLDLHLYMKNHPELDFDKIHQTYTTTEYAKELRMIEDFSRNLFDFSNPLYQHMSKEALNSGLYGVQLFQIQRQMEESKHTHVFSWLLSKWFMPYRTVSLAYPIISRLPILLPVFYVYRLIYFVIFAPWKVWKKIRLARVAKKRAKKMEKLKEQSEKKSANR